jgi:hypothetical protein
MKRGRFTDKETCLKYCEKLKFDRPVYLYKRVLIPDGWLPFIMRSKYQSFCWKVKATRLDQPDRTLLIGPWFQTPKIYLRHFKNRLREEYDVADGWGTTNYLVMRRHLGDCKRHYFLKHLERPIIDSLDISDHEK